MGRTLNEDDVLKEIDRWIGYLDEDMITRIKIGIKKLSSERKKGKWIHEIVNRCTEKTYCSECGGYAPFVFVSDDYYGIHVHGEDRKTDFCPNCGADMRGEE